MGSASVGKSSLLDKFKFDRFTPSRMAPTVGLSFVPTMINIKDKKMRLDFWDTAGE